MWPMLIYQSKANLDEKILFGKITHLKEPTIDHLAILKMSLNGTILCYIL